MIKIRNKSELLTGDLSVAGSLAVANDKSAFVVPFACTLKGILAKVGSAGVTGSGIVDIKKNGVSIFAGATKLTFASGSQTPTYDALAAGAQSLAKGDILTVDVTQASTTPAKNLGLLLNLSRKYSDAVQTGSIGADAE